MRYSTFWLGVLCLDGKPQPSPQQPVWDGDIPPYSEGSSISIEEAGQDEPIIWIKPEGLNLLVADRVLLTCASWEDLDRNGLVNGKIINIGGQRFRCRLPYMGAEEQDASEWSEVLNAAGEEDSLWHWKGMFSLAVEAHKTPKVDVKCRVVRGCNSANFFSHVGIAMRHMNIGFRPVLEPLGVEAPKPNCKLDGADFQMTNLPGGHGFCPVLQPVGYDVFADISDGSQVKMYTLIEDGRPVHVDGGFKNAAKLTLTDRYFGDEYLVPWTISNGVAVANQALLQT